MRHHGQNIFKNMLQNHSDLIFGVDINIQTRGALTLIPASLPILGLTCKIHGDNTDMTQIPVVWECCDNVVSKDWFLVDIRLYTSTRTKMPWRLHLTGHQWRWRCGGHQDRSWQSGPSGRWPLRRKWVTEEGRGVWEEEKEKKLATASPDYSLKWTPRTSVPELQQHRAFVVIPKDDPGVVRGRGQQRPVWRELARHHIVVVALQLADQRVLIHVP